MLRSLNNLDLTKGSFRQVQMYQFNAFLLRVHQKSEVINYKNLVTNNYEFQTCISYKYDLNDFIDMGGWPQNLECLYLKIVK